MTTALTARQKQSRRSLQERNALVLQWSGLPDRVYKNHCGDSLLEKLGREDAIQSGFLGLIRAAELWDEVRGVQFQTYAYRCILSKMRTQATENSLIRTPRSSRPASVRRQEQRARAASLSLYPGYSYHLHEVPWASEDADGSAREFLEKACQGPNGHLLKAFYVEGLTCRQIGQRLGLSHESIRQRLASTVQDLRQRLGVVP